MSLQEFVEKILNDVSLDDDADPRDSSRVEELEKLVRDFGWEASALARWRDQVAVSEHEGCGCVDVWTIAEPAEGQAELPAELVGAAP
jgi:hypothetical protein